MFQIPRYKSSVSLIPGGLPQFLDFQAPTACAESFQYAFEELVMPESAAGKKDIRSKLRVYRKNEEKEFVDELDGKTVYGEDGYKLSGLKGIGPWLGEWLPLPYLRVIAQVREDGDSSCKFAPGPTNWARGRLIVDPLNSDQLRLVIVFDMQLEDPKAEGVNTIYAALSPADVAANDHFRLAWRLRDNAFFLDLPWVEKWLKGIWDAKHPRKRKYDYEQKRFEHIASYLLFLECIQKISAQCEVYVINPDQDTNVNVDLVLDIGNSRTTGLLLETRPQTVTNINESYLLQLRDLNAPEHIYTDPFETRIEFTEFSFGNDALSERSGRRTIAFSWPSVVRIGPEAARLATLSRSGMGATGMSSPKRYLWDEREWKKSWRFNTQTEDAPFVSRGELAFRINSYGIPLSRVDEPYCRNLKKEKKDDYDFPVMQSLFMPSSLMMFLFVEILQQALLTVNSPGQRIRRMEPERPRRLRQVIFTFPPAMPLAEQNIYRRWAKWAVRLLWESLGWEKFYEEDAGGRKEKNPAKKDYRASPVIRCEWDEATCTQLLYLYNEITRQFQGDARLFFELMGRKRKINDKLRPSIRIATIDIGGGTTDLSITTYELASDASSATRLAPHPEFHDGFNLAGDDILRSVIWENVLPPIESALADFGIAHSQNAKNLLFGKKSMDTSIEVSSQRIQFTRQIAIPVALCLLEMYEKINPVYDTGKITFKIGDCFIKPAAKDIENASEKRQKEKFITSLFPFPGLAALDYVKDYVARETGRNDFNILEIPITFDPALMGDITGGVLANILQQLCEVIKTYDSDVLLLTGRPTRWPGVVNLIKSFMAVPPGRLVPMGEYYTGNWYPFADASGKIIDPKTTVAVGAILCALAEGQLEGFSFDPARLIVPSTARYIGELEDNGKLRREKVWFKVDPETSRVFPEETEIIWNGPISIGFRQLETERWPTTRYYVLESLSEVHRDSLRVKIKFIPPDMEDAEENRDNLNDGEFEILEAESASGESARLVARLQTLPRDDGFWMDTGEILDN